MLPIAMGGISLIVAVVAALALCAFAMSSKEMRERVSRGETVSWGGKLIRDVRDVPNEADNATSADDVDAAITDLQNQRDELDRQIKDAEARRDQLREQEAELDKATKAANKAEAQRQKLADAGGGGKVVEDRTPRKGGKAKGDSATAKSSSASRQGRHVSRGEKADAHAAAETTVTGTSATTD